MVLAVVLGFVYVGFIHLASQRSPGVTGGHGFCCRFLSHCRCVAVLFYFVQTALLMSPANEWISFLQFVNFSPQDTAGSGQVCVAPLDVYQKFGLSLFTPVIFLAMLLIIWAVHYVFHCLGRNTKSFLHTPPSVTAYLRTILSLAFLSYTQVCVCFSIHSHSCLLLP